MESKFKCPLLSKIIYDSDCYDINMVANGMIKETAIEEKIDKKKALEICNNCKNNQLK
jgi:hypothetical protein